MIATASSGAVGEPTGTQENLFALRDYDPEDRLFSPTLGGGVTLDFGVYALDFAIRFLGELTEVSVMDDQRHLHAVGHPELPKDSRNLRLDGGYR